MWLRVWASVLTAYNSCVETTGTAMILNYDDGVFTPQGTVPPTVKNHSTVRVVIVDDAQTLAAEGSRAEEGVADGWKMIQSLKGCITDTPPGEHIGRDHDEHLYGR